MKTHILYIAIIVVLIGVILHNSNYIRVNTPKIENEFKSLLNADSIKEELNYN